LEALPTVPIWLSLAVIVTTLAVTTVLSLRKARRDPDAVKQLPGPAA
jgi:tellurite resistance protein TerC